MIKIVLKPLAFLAVCALALAGASGASATSFINGGFEDGTLGQINSGGSVTGWYVPKPSYTDVGYTFVENTSVADTTGVSGQNGYHFFVMWGKNSGGLDTITASPNGGNFIAQDGAYDDEPLDQDISGLVVGKTYTVGFYWGAGQQTYDTGATSEQWQVSLGDSAPRDTPTISNASKGFNAWQHESFTFTADATTETLSFLAIGTPNGTPPLSLLDGVTFGVVPEPATWAMMILGVAGLGLIARRRRAGVAASAAA